MVAVRRPSVSIAPSSRGRRCGETGRRLTVASSSSSPLKRGGTPVSSALAPVARHLVCIAAAYWWAAWTFRNSAIAYLSKHERGPAEYLRLIYSNDLPFRPVGRPLRYRDAVRQRQKIEELARAQERVDVVLEGEVGDR